MAEKSNEDRLSSIDLAAQAGAAAERVSRFGAAEKEHYVAYSGKDNESGNVLVRGLKKTSQSKVNPQTAEQNIKQQAGYSAEDKYTARQNAENIINGKRTRYSRTDDLGRVNDPLYDHVQLDVDGEIIACSGEQMKFVGGTPKTCLNKLASQKFKKYLDADAKINIPSDFYDDVITEADRVIVRSQKQLVHARVDGNTELQQSLENRINKYQKIKTNVRNSGITNKEALEARLHPILSTAKDVTRLAHRAGIEQSKWGAGISGGISLIRNLVSVVKGEKEPLEAAKNVTKESLVGAGASYITAFAGSMVKGCMQNARSSTLRSVSKTNAPAGIVTGTIDVVKSMKRYLGGDISGVECLEEIGEKGVGHLSAAIFATVGQTVIPVPVVGAMVGSMIGYSMSSTSYQSLLDSLKQVELARERRIQIEAECAQARSMIAEYRAEIEQMIESYFQSYTKLFYNALSDMDMAMNIGDINMFINANVSIQNSLGYNPTFTTMEEFEEIMKSDTPYTL